MSTVKTTLLALVALATLGTSIGASRPQDGPRPVTLVGPHTVSSGGTYTYTVSTASSSAALAAPSPFDVTVHIDCDSANWVDLPTTVTIPAGQSSVSFDATVAPDSGISLDTMTASNSNGSVSAEILVVD